MRRWALLGLVWLAPAWTSAATFSVTTLADSGAGSLRDAVGLANAAPGADTITFAVTGTITLTSGLILVTDALTIDGPGPALLTIDGNAQNRIFAIVEAGAPACPALTGPADYLVTIGGLTLRNAQRNVANSSSGAIYSVKSLVIDDVTFENNRARAGGAIGFFMQYPNQSLTITHSRFTGNEAREIVAPTTGTHFGGAVGVGENCTGTRTAPVTVTITDSVFTGNVARAGTTNARGGALFFSGDADVTITRTTMSGNMSLPPVPASATINGQGGAISGGAQTLTIRDSTISGNEAQRSSALQLFNDAAIRQTFLERMRANVINSTISGNRAYETSTLFAYANVQLGLYNSVVVGNRTDGNRTSGVNLVTGATVPPGASNAIPPTLRLESSILWNPLGVRDIGKDVNSMPDPLAIPSNNSIIGRLCNEDCGPGPMTLTGTGNQVGVDPLLGPLADNGGPTLTRLPQLGSPSTGMGNNVLALTTDQRGAGFPRTIGAVTDAGATEYAYTALCDGFADVTGDNVFCPSVSWMKNRAVTLGCGGGNYCPAGDVIRLAMAAFMQRLGGALSGAAIMKTEVSGLQDFALGPRVCATDPIPAATAPRRAIVNAVFSGLAGADSYGRASIVASADGGATWQELQLFNNRATFKAGLWRSLPAIAQYDVAANATVRFALLVDRGSTTAPAGVLDSTCRLRVRLENSSGFTPN